MTEHRPPPEEHQPPPDLTELFKGVRRGDPAAGEKLHDLSFDFMMRRTRRCTTNEEDAKDLAHDAFIRAFLAIKNDQVRDQGPARFFGWLGTVVSNLAIDNARRKKRRPEEPLEPETLAYQADPRAPDPQDEAQRTEEVSQLRRALNQLEKRQLRRALNQLEKRQQRQCWVVVMLYLGECTYKEVAAALGISCSTVQRDEKAGLATLRRLLGDESPGS